MKKLFTILFICLSGNIFGQGTQSNGTAIANLDITNINPSILTGGDMFHDLQSNNPSFPGYPNQGFEVPRGSRKHTMYSAALWIGGTDPQNNVYVATQTYREKNLKQAGFWPGPVGHIHDSDHSLKYDKIWKISKQQVQDHISNYFKPGYKAPADITNWPGNGNTANGEAAKLAPFVDLNNNGIYEPIKGDYPEISGDQALYLILNEKGNIKSPASPVMNIEIHVMFYGFNNPSDTAVYNSLFCQYRIINRGSINFTKFYAGIWADFDLGFYNDDFIGCDTLNNSFYVYNGDDFDDGANGYGYNPPIQSVMFLDQKMSHFMYYNNDNNIKNGNPKLAADYYNYLRGHWKNNAPLTYGADGTNQQNSPISYMFPGDPETRTGWTEFTPYLTGQISNTPADRRGVGSIGPFDLFSGQELKFTVVYTFSRPTPGPRWFVCSFGQSDLQAVQTYFNNKIANQPEPIQGGKSWQLYPNPVTNQVFITLPANFAGKDVVLKILDNTGRELLSATFPQASPDLYLDVKSLKAGIYMTQIISGNQILTSRLVKL